MYRSIVRRTGRASSKIDRAVHQMAFGQAADVESAKVTGLRGLSATNGVEAVDEQQCLQRMVAKYLDNQLSDAEERMLGAYLAQLRTGSGLPIRPGSR